MIDEVTIETYEVRSDAEIARARLAADGIPALVEADDEGGLNPGFYRDYGVRLVVAGSDAEDAYRSLGIERIHLDRGLAAAIANHAAWAYPNEACGLVLFDDATPVFACCLTNIQASPHRFTIDPGEHHGALRLAERHGWRVGGVFHSHPRSEAYPSPSDVGGGADAEWVHFIAGPVVGKGGTIRAYRISGGRVAELSLAIGA